MVAVAVPRCAACTGAEVPEGGGMCIWGGPGACCGAAVGSPALGGGGSVDVAVAVAAAVWGGPPPSGTGNAPGWGGGGP